MWALTWTHNSIRKTLTGSHCLDELSLHIICSSYLHYIHNWCLFQSKNKHTLLLAGPDDYSLKHRMPHTCCSLQQQSPIKVSHGAFTEAMKRRLFGKVRYLQTSSCYWVTITKTSTVLCTSAYQCECRAVVYLLLQCGCQPLLHWRKYRKYQHTSVTKSWQTWRKSKNPTEKGRQRCLFSVFFSFFNPSMQKFHPVLVKPTLIETIESDCLTIQRIHLSISQKKKNIPQNLHSILCCV